MSQVRNSDVRAASAPAPLNAVTVVREIEGLMKATQEKGAVYFSASCQQEVKARSATFFDVFLNKWNGTPLPRDMTSKTDLTTPSSVAAQLQRGVPVTLTTHKCIEFFDNKRRVNKLHWSVGEAFTVRSIEELGAVLPDLKALQGHAP
jgi:hypothetical protein